MGMLNRKLYAKHKLGDKVKPVVVCSPESKCKRSFGQEADINVIMKRFKATGHIQLRPNPGQFVDVSGLGDFAEATRRVNAAKASFMALPGRVRSIVGGSPEALMEYVADPANWAEAIKLGLVPAPKEVAAAPVAKVPASRADAPEEAGKQ